MINCDQIAVESARLKATFEKCYNLKAIDLRSIVDLIESVSACSGGSFNLKTINGQSLLGVGNIVITATVDGTETKIQQGNGIAIEGNGSVANPYVVTNSSMNTSDGSETKINQGSNIVISGTGTTASPYVVNAIIPAIDAQVNSDWSAISGPSMIVNKPEIPLAQVNSDWNSTSGPSQILNKPAGVSTDLFYEPIPTGGQLTSNNGTGVTIPLVSDINAGLISPSMISELKTNVDNIKLEISLPTPTIKTNADFANEINLLASFQISSNQIPTFKSIEINEEETTVFYTEILGKGAGLYGIGGYQLSASQVKVTSFKLSANVIEEDPSTQIINLGINAQDVLTAINTEIPNIAIQGNESGYVIVKGFFSDGEYKEYLWVGAGGIYGGEDGALQAVLEDLVELTDTSINKANASASGIVKTNLSVADPVVYLKETTDSLLLNKVNKNAPIVAGTKSKITYDEKGLVIAGSNITKTDIGLMNVDNTSDLAKPISTATMSALDLKVDKVIGKSLISDIEIVRLAGLSNIDITGKEDISNKQNSLSTDGTGLKYTTVDAIASGTSYKRTIAQIRVISGILPNNNFYVTDLGKEGEWYYDPTDTTSNDNTGTVLVTADGKRIKRSFISNELNITWFINNKLAKHYSSGISITTGTNVLNVAGANFDSSFIGSKIKLYAGGVGGTFLIATITAVNSATQVLLSTNSALTLTNQKGIIGGFDETLSFQKAIDILNEQGGKLIVPQGRYYIDGTVYIKPINMSVPISIEGQNDMVLQDAWATSAYGVSILKNTAGDVFRVNMNESGLGIITYPGQYVGFSVKNISFIGDDVTSGINAFNIFRSRVNIQNISSHRIDYVVKQLATDIAGVNPTYCDMSLYKNIRVQQSKLGGLMLRYSDNSTISELYFEGGDTNSKHMLEVYNTSSIFGYNFLHGVMNNEQNTAGSALVKLEQVFGGVFVGFHSESCNFENIFYIVNCGAIKVSGLQTTLERNNAFKLSAIKGLTVDAWYDYTDISVGSYDIDFGTNNSNRDITWNNISSFNVAQLPGVSRREITFNNMPFRGLTYYESPVEYISDMNSIDGNKQFRSKSGCLNLPSGLSFLSGTQYLTADNNNYRVQSGMGGDFIYTRYMSNGVWGNWNKVLNATDLNNTALTGVPTAPTASANTNTTQVATTANVVSTINSKIAGTNGFIPAFNSSNSVGDSIIRNSTTGIGIGGGTNSLARIRLTSDSTHQYGLLLDTAFSQSNSSVVFLTPSFNSGVTTRANVFRASSNTTAEAFTLPDLRLFSAENGGFGAGSTVTDFTGFYAGALSGASNNYGFRGALTSASNRWNIYMDGTAKNYLLGNTLIGSNVDSGDKLQVTGNANITGNTNIGGNLTVSTNISSSSANLILSDINGVSFRSLRSSAWADSLSSRFLQIGTPSDNVVFSTQSANNANRMLFASNATQFSSGNYLTTPAPLGIFEVTNGTSRVFNAFSNGNITLGTQPTTSASTYDFLTRNISTGVIEKISSNAIATIASPSLTGVPTAPTATLGSNGTQIANTIFVNSAITTADLENVKITGFQEITGLKSFKPATNSTGVQVVPVSGNGVAFLADLVSNSTTYSGFFVNNNGTGFNYVGQNSGVNTFTVSKTGDITGNLYTGGANLTGVPKAPTASLGTNTTQIATTAFVQGSFVNLTGNQTITGRKNFTSDNTIAGGLSVVNSKTTSTNFSDNFGMTVFNTGRVGIYAENTTAETTGDAIAIGNNSNTGSGLSIGNFSTGTALMLRNQFGTGDLLNAELGKVRITSLGEFIANSPTFTGTPIAPTASLGTNTTQIATTAFVQATANSNAILLAGNQTATGRKSLTSDNTTSGGITVVNSKTSTATFGDNAGIYISNTGTAGITIETSGGNGLFAKSITNGNAITAQSFGTGTALTLRNQGGTGDLLQADNTGGITITKINSDGKLTTTLAPTASTDVTNKTYVDNTIKAQTGWANYSTTTYTSASPFSIAPASTVTLPNNANNSIITDLPLGVTAFYNGTTNKITPASIGDSYIVNIRFKAKTTTNNDYLTLYIDIGSGSQINAEAKQFLKGANTEQAFNFTLPIFTLATFVSNGGLIKIISNAGTISVYDITYFITRNYTR
jgi:hypothetical protein